MAKLHHTILQLILTPMLRTTELNYLTAYKVVKTSFFLLEHVLLNLGTLLVLILKAAIRYVSVFSFVFLLFVF